MTHVDIDMKIDVDVAQGRTVDEWTPDLFACSIGCRRDALSCEEEDPPRATKTRTYPQR